MSDFDWKPNGYFADSRPTSRPPRQCDAPATVEAPDEPVIDDETLAVSEPADEALGRAAGTRASCAQRRRAPEVAASTAAAGRPMVPEPRTTRTAITVSQACSASRPGAAERPGTWRRAAADPPERRAPR